MSIGKDGVPRWFRIITDCAAFLIVVGIFSTYTDWGKEHQILLTVTGMIAAIIVFWYLATQGLQQPIWPRKE